MNSSTTALSTSADTPVILITGAAKRIGAEIARTLHAAGARVMLHYRSSANEASVLAQELNALRPDSASCVQGDLCDASQAEYLAAYTFSYFGRIDALINNASSFRPTPIGEINEALWLELVGSNLKGPLFLSQAAAQYLKKTCGVIINITDIHAEYPLKNFSLYCIAKAGLLGMTRALALDMAPDVRVNAVAPGPIEWPIGAASSHFDTAVCCDILARTPLKRQGTSADIASSIQFLVFNAPYVTGQIIHIDGGRTIAL